MATKFQLPLQEIRFFFMRLDLGHWTTIEACARHGIIYPNP
jgi:hypothetical protein